jgi:flagellar biosynthesis protein FlhB
MASDNKSEEATIAKFQEAMEKANVTRIADEILAGLSVDSEDSEDLILK